MRFFFITVLALFQLTGCYDLSRKFVQQGNLLPQSKINRLKPGMSKESVAILMGNSIMNPTFNEDRWDYAYTFRTAAAKPEVKSISLYFSRGILRRIEQHG